LANEDIKASSTLVLDRFWERAKENAVFRTYRGTFNLARPFSLDPAMKFFATAKNLRFHSSYSVDIERPFHSLAIWIESLKLRRP
jgi:hypothetical protein